VQITRFYIRFTNYNYRNSDPRILVSSLKIKKAQEHHVVVADLDEVVGLELWSSSEKKVVINIIEHSVYVVDSSNRKRIGSQLLAEQLD